MGFFSWLTQDTEKSIPNQYSDRTTFPVYLKDNKGNVWEENEYEGYGVFGGKDFFELVAEMNGKTTRDEGHTIAFSGQPYLSPNLFEDKDSEWTNSIPQDCEFQGYFYCDEDDDMDDDDDFFFDREEE